MPWQIEKIHLPALCISRTISICHGIQILAAADILEGKRVTCYEHVRSEVKLAKGTWDKRQAVRDGNLVTAQTWESHPEFYREVFGCLRG